MTAPKPVFPNTTYLITRRTIDRFLLLRPDPRVNHLLLYLVAFYARQYGIEIYAYAALSNHHHIVCHDVDGVYPDFCRDLHSTITRALNSSRGRLGAMWSPDRGNPVALWHDESILDKIAYTKGNACSSHLVDRPEDWPGVVTSVGDICGPPIKIERPSYFFGPTTEFPDVVYLEIKKPARFSDWTIDRYRTEISRRIDEKCADARRERRRLGIPVVGRLKVLNQDIYDKPETRERLRTRTPLFACADPELRMALLEWLKQFRILHREARAAFESGDHEVAFPSGTYLHHKVYGVDCSALGPPPKVQ